MTIRSLLAAVVVALALPAHPAEAAPGDPLQSVYIFTGARDDGSPANNGVATVVTCTIFSSTTEKIRWIALSFGGGKAGDVSYTTMGPSDTRTMVTHPTEIYPADVTMSNPGPTLNQGAIYVFATTTNIVCTASVVAANSTNPLGIDLHGIRSAPAPGTTE